jgi:hypothetical protein
MGILDEAIREHLELKRRSGAADAELKRMEDEAFGPPTRPGEPDFPDSEEAAVHGGNGTGTEGALAEAPTAQEAPLTPLPESPPAEPEPETPAEEPGEGEEPPPELPSEPAAEEQPQLEDLDLELERGEPEEQAEPEPEAEPVEGSGEAEAPIESLDTVEHPFPDEEAESTEHELEPPSEEHAAHEAEHEEEEEGDDVLADTPEFLKDAPEDDELWFEQGEPKDFDF